MICLLIHKVILKVNKIQILGASNDKMLILCETQTLNSIKKPFRKLKGFNFKWRIAESNR